jgi:hypothetical protein
LRDWRLDLFNLFVIACQLFAHCWAYRPAIDKVMMDIIDRMTAIYSWPKHLLIMFYYGL